MHNIILLGMKLGNLCIDSDQQEDGGVFDCSCGAECKPISFALFEFMHSESQWSQAFEKTPIWVLWSIQPLLVSSSQLCVCVCVCVCVCFQAHKLALQSNLCSHRSHLVPDWSHKCKHIQSQVFNEYMSN